jgi:hypothetical protein
MIVMSMANIMEWTICILYNPWVFCSTLVNHFVSYICLKYKKWKRLFQMVICMSTHIQIIVFAYKLSLTALETLQTFSTESTVVSSQLPQPNNFQLSHSCQLTAAFPQQISHSRFSGICSSTKRSLSSNVVRLFIWATGLRSRDVFWMPRM